MYRLSYVLHDLERPEEAEHIARECLSLREKVLGKENERTIYTIDLLAFLSYIQGKFEDSLVYGQRALAGFEKVLGSDHAYTIACKERLERARREQAEQSVKAQRRKRNPFRRK